MKTLYLLRHAKSSWKFPELDDFDRPLNKRGQGDTPLMGKRLRKRNILPDLIISSPAQRAKHTAQEVAQSMGYSSTAILYDEAVYEASAETLLTTLQTVDNRVAVLLLAGHNPGMTELANKLTPHYIDNIVTAGVVAIQFLTDDWAEVGKSSPGQFLWYDYPKSGR